MKVRPVVSPLARRDFEAHALFIVQDNLEAALRFQDAVEAVFERLAEQPRLGRLRTFLSTHLADLRSFVIPGFESYVIFYRLVGDRVQVVRLLHGAQDIDRILGR